MPPVKYLPFVETAPLGARRGVRWQRAALVFVIVWFVLGGIAHFAATDMEMRIVPPWIPYPREVVLFSGALELLGALGIALPGTRQAAGWGLFALTLAVTPANVYMLSIHDQFPVPLALLWARLPLQAVLLWLIVWGSRWRAAPSAY